MGDYSRSDVVTCLYSLVVHKEALFGQYEVLVGCQVDMSFQWPKGTLEGQYETLVGQWETIAGRYMPPMGQNEALAGQYEILAGWQWAKSGL